MEYREAIHGLKPKAVIAVKIVGEAIVRTAIYFTLFMAVLIILNLYNTDNYPIYIGFIVGSIIANITHIMMPYLQKPVKEPRMQ